MTQALMEVLTVSQVADLLGLKESTVRAWILRRKISYLKIHRSVRVERSVVEQLLEASRVPAK